MPSSPHPQPHENFKRREAETPPNLARALITRPQNAVALQPDRGRRSPFARWDGAPNPLLDHRSERGSASTCIESGLLLFYHWTFRTGAHGKREKLRTEATPEFGGLSSESSTRMSPRMPTAQQSF